MPTLLALLARIAGDAPAGLLSPPHGARRDFLHQQLEAAGFIDVAVEEQTFLDHFADLAAVLEWNESSFFGNFLQGSSPSQNPELWAEMERTLERLRQPAGIELERYLFLVRPTKH